MKPTTELALKVLLWLVSAYVHLLWGVVALWGDGGGDLAHFLECAVVVSAFFSLVWAPKWWTGNLRLRRCVVIVVPLILVFFNVLRVGVVAGRLESSLGWGYYLGQYCFAPLLLLASNWWWDANAKAYVWRIALQVGAFVVMFLAGTGAFSRLLG